MEEKAFEWDSVIENDSAGSNWIYLQPGEYPFTITEVKKSQHEPSAKLPACPQAIVTVEIKTAEGTASINTNLFLHPRCEGILCSFFTCIGMRKHGEKLRMDFNSIVGKSGRCQVSDRVWTGNDGNEHKSNEIKRWIAPASKAFTPGTF